jgi:hypothetical protein
LRSVKFHTETLPAYLIGNFRVWLKIDPARLYEKRPTAAFLRSVVTPPVPSRSGRSREARWPTPYAAPAPCTSKCEGRYHWRERTAVT